MIRMSGLLVSACAALVLAGAVQAQVPAGMGAVSADTQKLGQNGSVSAARFETGMRALQSGNFTVAEGIFSDILRQNPAHPDANLYMGVAQMGQEKWEDAKKYLEIAVKKNPKSPDPKSRLAITYIKLGDVASAMKQRDDLVKMDKACKTKCRNAEWIANALAMVDGSLPPKS